MPRVIAQREESDIYLIQVSETEGRIADFESGKYFPAFNIQSIIARGYWIELTEAEQSERGQSVLDRLSELTDVKG